LIYITQVSKLGMRSYFGVCTGFNEVTRKGDMFKKLEFF